MVRSVVGNYTSVAEAEAAVKDLLDNGYPKDAITLVVNKNIVPALRWDDVHVETGLVTEDGEQEESLWERVKNFFGGDDNSEEYRNNISVYQEDLNNGNVLVVVDENYANNVVGQGHVDHVEDRQQVAADHTAMHHDVDHVAAHDVDHDRTVQLREERLNVGKDRVQTGEAVIRKNIVEETKTVEVPVTREELVIERHPVKDGEVVGDVDFTEKEVSIPLTEEQVHITKEPVVTEEIHIKKRDIHDKKAVTDTIRKEKLDVENTGSAVIKKDDKRV